MSDYSAPDAAERVAVSEDADGLEELLEKLRRFGFAVATLPLTSEPSVLLERMATWMKLGDPYVPMLYQGDDRYAKRYVDIRPNRAEDHPSFSTGAAQNWHIDGLLEPLGTIKTSLLYCVQPAAAGGRTIVFNSRRAFTELMIEDPEAAKVLLKPYILTRVSTLPGVTAEATGPVFGYDDDGELIGRYAEGGDTERWCPAEEDHEALKRARAYFAACCEADGPLRRAIGLVPGDCLIIRNHWVSHAREAFVDDMRRPRHLVRSLYLNELP